MKNYKNPSLSKISFQSLTKNLASAPQLSFGSSAKLTSSNDGLRTSSGDPVLRGISFGSPSSRGSSGTSTGTGHSGWAGLLGAGSSGVLGSLASGILGGLGVGQLLSGALGLLGGSGSNTLPPLQRFTLPDPQQFSKTLSVPTTLRSSSSSINAGSQTRSTSSLHQGEIGPGRSNGAIGSMPGGQPVSIGHQVHVHVSALDTQSFMDRSSDIAKAVKNAMLQSSSLNDVISEI